MPVGFFPPIVTFLVHQSPDLKPFSKKEKSNLNKLCAITGILKYFSLAFSLQKEFA